MFAIAVSRARSRLRIADCVDPRSRVLTLLDSHCNSLSSDDRWK